MAWSFLTPKKPGWMKASVALAVVSLGIYAVVAWRAPFRLGSRGGLSRGESPLPGGTFYFGGPIGPDNY